MRRCRIHIVGAAGSGTTTLGRALADALAVPHHDTDDYFWIPTTPPYLETRDVPARLRLMREVFLDRAGWVLSGSLDDWGASIVPLFDLVVFLSVPTDVRLRRLRDREARHFGSDSIAPGGWRHEETEGFLEWAAHYDDGTREGRSLGRHLAWLETLSCPVMRLDGTRTTSELVDNITDALRRRTTNR
jgi:adenylate kinase family enzyme